MAAPRITLGPFLGEVPKPDSAYRKTAVASFVQDCYLDTGAIRPMRTDRRVSAATGLRLHHTECCIKAFDHCVNLSNDDVGCEYVFATGFNSAPLRPDGGRYPIYGGRTEFCGGILTNMSWAAYALNTAPDVEYVVPVDYTHIVGGNNVHLGKHVPRSYAYAFQNIYGHRSPLSAQSAVQVHDFDAPAILTFDGNHMPDSTNHAVQRLIYALTSGTEDGSSTAGAGETMFYLVAAIDPLQETFTHNPRFGKLLEAYVDDYVSGVHPEATSMQWLFDDRVAYLYGDALWFTDPGDYTRVHDKYTLTFADKPKKFVATQHWGYVLTCGRPEVVDLTKRCDGNGCTNVTMLDERLPLIGPESTTTYMGAVFYASTTGVVAISGTHLSVITDDLFSLEQWEALGPDQMRLAVHRGFLYICGIDATYRLKLAATAYSKPAAADLVRLSIRPTAILVTNDDRLLYADAGGTWELEQGTGFKPFAWMREWEFNRPVAISAMRMTHSGGRVDATVTREVGIASVAQAYANVPSHRPFRIGKVMGRKYALHLTGTAVVTQVVLGASPYELE